MSQTDPDYDVPSDMACDAYKEAIADSAYRFPATRWATTSTHIAEQARKVCDEASEAFYATKHGASLEDVADELLDTIHAAETGLRILQALNDVDVNAACARVEAKNRARGYYEFSGGAL